MRNFMTIWPGLFITLILTIALTACGGGGSGGGTGSGDGTTPTSSTGGSTGGGTTNASVALLAWNDLGMHCMDGKDYSVFSILPPFNNLHAQLVDRSNGALLTSGVTVSYESTPDTKGSINTYSAGKVNFWQYASTLYGAPPTLPDNMGLAGYPMASPVPVALQWNATNSWFEAAGIPITPYDDALQKNYYPMVKVVARSKATTAVLASASIVLPVSDEMSCISCHASGSPAAAKPAAGWVNDPIIERDWKRNILRLHDERTATGLLASADGGSPILCASCHASNALPGTGKAGIEPLTRAIHSRHAGVADPVSGLALDDVTNRSACYQCHPGAVTKCLRDPMGLALDSAGKNAMSCQSCHGDMSAVGGATRTGWLEEPNCQACHHDGARELSALDSKGKLRAPSDTRFATNPNTPAAGFSLYRFSTGHGGLQCEACHGATHAVYPTSEANDNALAISLQGHEGTIAECAACHATVPLTTSGGPHGMHTIGTAWVKGHQGAADSNRTQCTACHGADYRGSPLSAAKAQRSLSVEDGTRTFAAGHQFSCYDCHNGPGGGD
jgi:hypothetical protein